ncbi:transcription antitermination factor NusB [Lachnospiraceae bacterium WCA-693-APC-MOT-I]|uniref:Transcription antitermination protein NusB n=2 Tax=Velocimicrobium porci TaxID=2606634 RepID=A0A6L5XXZ8_9FIRM|nr:transcription antitermination factor NusB [Velocimicrobium porci]
MKRREIREHLFLMLFCNDFYEAEELKEQAELYLNSVELRKEEGLFEEEGCSISEDDKIYLKSRFLDVICHLEEIDSMIETASTGWKLNRIGKEELTIMRLAVYEMKFDEEVPTKVAINEAVELAKKYGEDSARSFVNGILAKIAE